MGIIAGQVYSVIRLDQNHNELNNKLDNTYSSMAFFWKMTILWWLFIASHFLFYYLAGKKGKGTKELNHLKYLRVRKYKK